MHPFAVLMSGQDDLGTDWNTENTPGFSDVMRRLPQPRLAVQSQQHTLFSLLGTV